jgi:uncharacterized protein YyaL (SSP411 family)
MLLFFANAELSADKLYTWTDEKGNVHITEHPPPKNAKTMDVMTYQPQTEVQIQKNEADERREEMQYQADQKKDTKQENKKTSAKTERQYDDDDDEVYIDREGKMIRRGEESKEMRDRRQDVQRKYRYHRR